MNSREKYLTVSLELFSQYGYYGVSVRDISKKVGVSESALYKHYKSKSQILEEIINIATEKFNEFSKKVSIENSSIRHTMSETYIQLYCFYVEDDFMNKFRKIMVISQYQTEEARKRYEDMFIKKSITYYEEVFDKILRQKNIKNVNSKLMAYELYSVLYLLLQQYDNPLSKDIEIVKKLLRLHINNFFDKYKFLEDKNEK